MRKNVHGSSCDLPASLRSRKNNRSRRYPFQGDFTWKGVRAEDYKTGGSDWEGILRQVIIGSRGETAKFSLRYFEIAPGGYSSHETHEHEHVVVGIRGEGKALMNRRAVRVGFLDVVYVSPGTPHRLFNPFSEPFGFFCIVNRERDHPRPVGR
ncbi:MAG: cupin domain-containing protein [Nitrospiraceae bacterium]|nr:MAG: cupin domain-containing protein [Nitrospiraceae bacterium]